MRFQQRPLTAQHRMETPGHGRRGSPTNMFEQSKPQNLLLAGHRRAVEWKSWGCVEVGLATGTHCAVVGAVLGALFFL